MLEGLSGLPKEAWLAFGALAGAAATIIVGWFNLRKNGTASLAAERAELSEGQRAMINILRNEVNALHHDMAKLELALKTERETCQAKLEELDARHSREMQQLREQMSGD